MIENLTTPAEWGRFGLAGMVIGALFAQVGWFLRVLKSKDETHQKFIQRILDDDRGERREDRQEHKETTNRLSDAIDGLAQELRKKN